MLVRLLNHMLGCRWLKLEDIVASNPVVFAAVGKAILCFLCAASQSCPAATNWGLLRESSCPALDRGSAPCVSLREAKAWGQ
jgi:hypothetical protein